MAVTPRPWRRSPNASDAIISDVPTARRVPDNLDDDEREYYGGYVVAESIQSADREFILRAVTFFDRMTAGHAAACRIHDGTAPCDRLPGCLQDGR